MLRAMRLIFAVAILLAGYGCGGGGGGSPVSPGRGPVAPNQPQQWRKEPVDFYGPVGAVYSTRSGLPQENYFSVSFFAGSLHCDEGVVLPSSFPCVFGPTDHLDGSHNLLVSLLPCPARHLYWPSACIEEITLDGRPSTTAEVKPGRMVAVHGTRLLPLVPPPDSVETGKVRIDLQRTVVGLVEAIDPDLRQLKVLGQRVLIDSATIISGTDPYAPLVGDLVVGDLVTVSGYFTQGGVILATRVEPKTDTGPYVLRGLLRDLSDGRLAIGDVEIDFAAATRENFPGGAPASGDPVLVFASVLPTNGVLAADLVRYTREAWVDSLTDDSRVGGVAGFVTGDSAGSLEVAGLVLGASANVEIGSFVVAGFEDSFVHARASISGPRSIGLVGPIETIDPATGAFQVLGFRVHASPATQIRADSDFTLSGPRLEFGDLGAGDWVTVWGGLLKWDRSDLGYVVSAGTIAREGSEPRIETYWGFRVDAPLIELVGHPILTDGATTIRRCDTPALQELGALDEFHYAYDANWIEVSLASDLTSLRATDILMCDESWFDY